MQKTFSPLLVLLALLAMPVQAQDSAVDKMAVDTTGIDYSNAPDSEKVAALKPFRDRHAQLFYLGRTANLDGWFMILPDNYVQIVYTSPDGNTLAIGFLIDARGRNLTQQQMINLRERSPEVNRLFTDKVEDAKKKLEDDRGFQELMGNLNLSKPGDKMYAELAQSPSIEIGDNKNAPLLLMMIDPQCPFCKQAYKKLYNDYISKGKLLVHLVPVGILGVDSVRMAERLLDKPNDVELWNKFVASDFSKDVLAGQATPQGVGSYSVNATLYNTWKLKGTPFFAYRSKDGTVKVLNETPADYAAVVNDIAPYSKVPLDPKPKE